MNSERKSSLIDKKSDMSYYFRIRNRCSQVGISQQHTLLHKRVEFKTSRPGTPIFNAPNKNESLKKKLKLWFNTIAERNKKIYVETNYVDCELLC